MKAFRQAVQTASLNHQHPDQDLISAVLKNANMLIIWFYFIDSNKHLSQLTENSSTQVPTHLENKQHIH